MESSLWLASGWGRGSLRECVSCYFVNRAVGVDRAVFDGEADEMMAYVDVLLHGRSSCCCWLWWRIGKRCENFADEVSELDGLLGGVSGGNSVVDSDEPCL